MARLLRWIVVLAVVVAAVGWVLTRPARLDAAALDGLAGDAARGAVVFAAAGCASCHVAPDSPDSDAPVLAGGQRFASDFGTFIAPNISPDPDAGIGRWTDAQVVEAVANGVAPGGVHLYPAFPYTSYHRADLADLADLVAYWRTLPPDATPSQPHELSFPFGIRRGVGLWKRLYLSEDWVVTGELTEVQARGRYLVEALGHCGECHTPRDALGGLDTAAWLGGAPNPSGDGRIPNITPAGLTWSEGEIAEFLKSGFTPDFDTAGGSMAEVIRNTARLGDADRAAIAAYLKVVPEVQPQDG